MLRGRPIWEPCPRHQRAQRKQCPAACRDVGLYLAATLGCKQVYGDLRATSDAEALFKHHTLFGRHLWFVSKSRRQLARGRCLLKGWSCHSLVADFFGQAGIMHTVS